MRETPENPPKSFIASPRAGWKYACFRPAYVWRRLRTVRTPGDVVRYVGLLGDFLAVLGRAGGGASAARRAARMRASKERYVPVTVARPIESTR